MFILGIIIIILLIRVIANQQEIDEHLCEKEPKDEDVIAWKGIINYVIFRFRVIISNIIYYLKNNKKD